MATQLEYPVPRKGDCVETLHGCQIEDPYRWMEDPDNAETAEYVTSQNKITLPYLDACPARDPFHETLTDLFNYPKQGCPYKRGNRFYYSYNTGLQNQNVLYQQDSVESPARVFLDPNLLSEDGTVSLSSYGFSHDGSILAYSLSQSGSDWKTIKFMRTNDGGALEDVLVDVKFSCISWTHDNKGLFYNRYPKADTSDLGTETNSNINQKLYYHRLGSPQSEDQLVVEFPDEPNWMPSCEVSDCGFYVIVSVVRGCEPANKLWICKMDSFSPPQNIVFDMILNDFEAEYEYIANKGGLLYLKTNDSADKYKLISLDLGSGDRNDVVAESECVLNWACCVRQDLLVTCYSQHCVDKLYISKLEDGTQIQEVALPPGSVVGYSGRYEDSFIYFKFMSFINPGVIYFMDLSHAQEEFNAKVFKETPIKGFESSDYETKQTFFESEDKAKIPMFITHKKGITLDGNNPTLMYGYGGFNISLSPSYSVSRMIFIKNMGGVYCHVNLRGGGEYGKEWHTSGNMAKKQNVFNDFIAAAETVIEMKYTSPKKIAIEGGSNGGLLVAACANQRPDLFSAVICHVGVLDMYRFHLFTIGHAWMTEYGNPGVAEDWTWLRDYSPLHTIPQTGDYPSSLLLTGDHDDRVVPLHSLKFIATLQTSRPLNPNPLLIRIDTKSGHGAGKPTTKRLKETADVFGFIARQLGAAWVVQQ